MVRNIEEGSKNKKGPFSTLFLLRGGGGGRQKCKKLLGFFIAWGGSEANSSKRLLHFTFPKIWKFSKIWKLYVILKILRKSEKFPKILKCSGQVVTLITCLKDHKSLRGLSVNPQYLSVVVDLEIVHIAASVLPVCSNPVLLLLQFHQEIILSWSFPVPAFVHCFQCLLSSNHVMLADQSTLFGDTCPE